MTERDGRPLANGFHYVNRDAVEDLQAQIEKLKKTGGVAICSILVGVLVGAKQASWEWGLAAWVVFYIVFATMRDRDRKFLEIKLQHEITRSVVREAADEVSFQVGELRQAIWEDIGRRARPHGG